MKNRYLVPGCQELDPTSSFFIPSAQPGDYLWEDTRFYIDAFNHAHKNFSLGVNCKGVGRVNHYSNGICKAYKNTGTGDYTGPIGNTLFIRGDKTSSSMSSCDIHGSPDKYVRITNVGKVNFIKNDTNSYAFQLFGGATYIDFTGDGDPTLTNELGKWDTWGFNFIQTSGNDVQIFNIGGKANHINLRNFHVDGRHHGFCGVMAKTDNCPELGTMNVYMHNFAVRRTRGEGIYMGQTAGNDPNLPQQRHKMLLKAHQFFIAETGTELLQVNQMHPDSEIYDFVCFAGSLTHKRPFHLNQVSGLQIFNRGGGYIHDFIVDGYCCNNIIKSDSAGDDPKGGSLVFDNFKIRNGRGKAFFLDTFNNPTDKIVFKNGRIEDINKGYDNTELRDIRVNRVFDTVDTVTPILLDNMILPDMPILVGGGLNQLTRSTTSRQETTDLEYECSGFESLGVLNLSYWVPYFGPHHPTRANQPMVYEPGHVIADNGLYWYITEYIQSDLHPSLLPGVRQVVWDIDGNAVLGTPHNTPGYDNSPPHNLNFKHSKPISLEVYKGIVFAVFQDGTKKRTNITLA